MFWYSLDKNNAEAKRSSSICTKITVRIEKYDEDGTIYCKIGLKSNL